MGRRPGRPWRRVEEQVASVGPNFGFVQGLCVSCILKQQQQTWPHAETAGLWDPSPINRVAVVGTALRIHQSGSNVVRRGWKQCRPVLHHEENQLCSKSTRGWVWLGGHVCCWVGWRLSRCVVGERGGRCTTCHLHRVVYLVLSHKASTGCEWPFVRCFLPVWYTVFRVRTGWRGLCSSLGRHLQRAFEPSRPCA